MYAVPDIIYHLAISYGTTGWAKSSPPISSPKKPCMFEPILCVKIGILDQYKMFYTTASYYNIVFIIKFNISKKTTQYSLIAWVVTYY